MKKLKIIIVLTSLVFLPSNLFADDYTRAPDGTYVRGDDYTRAPDGSYR